MKTFVETITFADTPTGNSNQIYPKDVLSNAIDIYMSKDKHYRYGCLHGPTKEGTVELDKISHHLADVWFEDNVLKGEIEVADTPMGKVLERLIDTVPEKLTLGLAAIASFKAVEEEVISRDLFEVYEPEQSQVVDDLAVLTIYVVEKVKPTIK